MLLDDEKIASLKRELRGWNERADEAARAARLADQGLFMAERAIGDIEAELRREGVDI